MWRNHIVTRTYADKNDMNLALNKIWFSYLHYNFRIGFEFEKLIKKRLKVTV